jgi:hypothetical protein
MGTQLGPISATPSTTGFLPIGFASAPLGGFNAAAALGTATSATVKLWVRVSSASDWLLAATLTLASGGETAANAPVYPPYLEARWEVTAIAGGTVKLDAIGVGV